MNNNLLIKIIDYIFENNEACKYCQFNDECPHTIVCYGGNPIEPCCWDWEDSDCDKYLDIQTILEEYIKGDLIMDFGIKKVIFNDPATIILWNNGDKTVVKCQDGDTFDKEKGFALALAKYAMGNQSNYNNIFKKYIKEIYQ